MPTHQSGNESFLGAIFNAIHNWSDNTQSRLPAYRDRIAHVQLEPGEGGLNLDMPKSLIDMLTARGARAGTMLRERFAGGAFGLNWTNHRRVRLRLASLEEMLGELEAVCAHPEPGDPDFESVIVALRAGAYSWKSRTQETGLYLTGGAPQSNVPAALPSLSAKVPDLPSAAIVTVPRPR
jgi:hypothetical protein